MPNSQEYGCIIELLNKEDWSTTRSRVKSFSPCQFITYKYISSMYRKIFWHAFRAWSIFGSILIGHFPNNEPRGAIGKKVTNHKKRGKKVVGKLSWKFSIKAISRWNFYIWSMWNFIKSKMINVASLQIILVKEKLFNTYATKL